MTLNELYNMSHEFPESLRYHNKYVWAIMNNLLEARYMDINDVITRDIPLSEYIKDKGIIMLFPNRINGKISDIYVRALDSKETPLKLGSQLFPFGIGLLSKDFKYGFPLILVEGISDMAAIKLVMPTANIIAVQSNSISQKTADFLSTITNKFIFIPDNDAAGIRGYNISKRRLEKLDCAVDMINQYGSLKDSGDILDIAMSYSKTHSEDIKQELISISAYYNMQMSIKL